MNIGFPVSRYMNTWEDVVDHFFNDSFVARHHEFVPSIEVKVDDNNVYVNAELPGMKKDDIHIEYHDGVLTLSGEKRRDPRKEEEHVYHTEIREGQFTRTVRVGHVDYQHAEARYEDGVLSITLPKSEDAKPSTLNIT